MDVILCDDETECLDSVRHLLDIWMRNTGRDERVFIKEFRSSEDLLKAWLNGLHIDLLFLDIQIPGEMSGMEIAKRIYEQDEYIPIVFITNYSEYASEGYAVNALRYLRKPVSQEDINTCMDIVWRQWANSHAQFLTLKTSTQMIRVPVEAIIYAEAASHILKIYSSDEMGKYEIRCTIEQLEENLPQSGFVRCHRSYMISLRHVRKYKGGVVTLSTGAEIPVGRKYVQSFSTKFRLYYQGGES